MIKLHIQHFDANPALLQQLAAEDENSAWFDFATSKSKVDRLGKDYYQLGDVELGLRKTNEQKWAFISTKDDQKLENSPVKVNRKWTTQDNDVLFSATLKNTSTSDIEIGGLGFAMIFNQIFTDNSLDESHNNSSFIDPYIGQDAGYLQVARLNGTKPTLLVVNGGNMPFEAYRPLTDDKTKKDVHFEGFYEWTAFSKAYFDTNWDGKRQWNTPSSFILKSGDSKTFSLKFIATTTPDDISEVLADNHIPSVSSLPGYVLHGKEHATLSVNTDKEISRIYSDPENAIHISNSVKQNTYLLNRLHNYYGQARVVLEYTDHSKQTINYFLTESASHLVKQLADFHQTKQWVDQPDKYGRKHSFITYDQEADRQVLDEFRSYISGDSDEAGAGPNLLMAIKNLYMPDKTQVQMLEQYVDEVLWGHLQNKDYSIKASLYYMNNDIMYSWNKSRSEETWRAYNYPHQAAIYWAMYRLARNFDGLVTNHDWQWYLNQAYQTVMAMHKFCGKDAFLELEQYGLMVGSVHKSILADLKHENWTKEANTFENYMKYRYQIWANLQYPYGSEMPWDSTGQEEVYTWCDYFDDQDKASKTVNAILAYTPLIPHWGYNGDSRRYFDSFVYGKREKITREFGHYGSSLNAIPIIDNYKYHDSNDLFKLKVGYAASTSILSSIDQKGFGSMAFLTDPEFMEFEPYTSDFGQAFYGYAHDAGQYVYENSDKEWLSFGGEINSDDHKLTLYPTDAFKHRLFIHTKNMDFEINSEVAPIASAKFDLDRQKIQINFSTVDIMPNALRINVSDNLVPTNDSRRVRGAYTFDSKSSEITFTAKNSNR